MTTIIVSINVNPRSILSGNNFRFICLRPNIPDDGKALASRCLSLWYEGIFVTHTPRLTVNRLVSRLPVTSVGDNGTFVLKADPLQINRAIPLPEGK